jgi:hypothetical protein
MQFCHLQTVCRTIEISRRAVREFKKSEPQVGEFP